jgi:beta-glucosidase
MTNMMRAPAAGRNWEGFGGDPFLAGEATYETIIGVQSQGVQATVKHLIDKYVRILYVLLATNGTIQ